MLQPKKTKYRRMQKGRMKGLAQRGNQLAFGSFGIKALDSTWITGRQIEAARQAIVRYMKREGQIWIRIFPDKPITKKPAEVRMGKGKGSPEGFVAPVTPRPYPHRGRRGAVGSGSGGTPSGCAEAPHRNQVRRKKGLYRKPKLTDRP